MRQRMIAVVVDDGRHRDYRPVESADLLGVTASETFETEMPGEYIVPEINGPTALRNAGSHRSINLELYGFTRWGQLFSHRQLVALHVFIGAFHEVMEEIQSEIEEPDYRVALSVCLALWISRIAARGNAFCRWFPGREAIQSPFSGQSIPMMWDFPEVNPFSNSPAGASRQLQRMIDVLFARISTG
jgi:putative DNA methylase